MLNRKYGYSGHLWQARFYSCVLDDRHLEHAARYVECNPVRAGMVDRAEDYAWSRAGPHVLRVADRYLDGGLSLIGVIKDWSAWQAGEQNEEVVCAIRHATTTGRACGSEDFVHGIEVQMGRCLRPQKRGRKSRPAGVKETEETTLPARW
jgi:putative transposase